MKWLDREADLNRARNLLSMLDEYFVVPRHRDNERIAYYSIEVVDTAFMLSMRERDQLTDWWVRQAKRCAEAILEAHFGKLQRRPKSSAD